MGELRLHAISVYDVRDMFGALPDLAAQLREIASNTFVVPVTEQQRRPSMIQRIGPLTRHNPMAIIYPAGQPTPADWETLLAGRYVDPDRVPVSWRVVDAWVDARDWGTATFPLNSQEVEQFDFSLTRAGLPAQFGLRNLLANDAALPLRPAHGMRVGYAKNQHVLATADALRRILDQVEEAPDGPAHYLSGFLDAFCEWTDQARRADRLLPDLFVVWWQTGRSEVAAPTGGEQRVNAEHDPTQPFTTGRQRRTPAPDPSAPFQTGRGTRSAAAPDPTQPIVTGRQARKDPRTGR